jgi:hypothetical protein
LYYKADPKLGNWVSNQRTYKKKGWLMKEQEQLLNELGFQCNLFHAAWMEKFHILKKFKKENGHCQVPKLYEADPSLASWVDRQRQDKRKGRLKEERDEMLEDLGFEFTPFDSAWMEQFRALEKFKQEHSWQCWVPQKYEADPTLGEWVHNQRQDKKRGCLSKERIQLLEELGFEWNKAKLWVEQFHALQKFKKDYGHCRVPIHYKADPSLGQWASNQRHKKKKGYLSEEREKMLIEMDFEWSLQ